MSIYRNNWDLINPFDRLNDLKKAFKEATVQPSANIIEDLIRQKKAQLDLIENRTESTIYLLRQTGVFYLVGLGINNTERFYSYLELDRIKPSLKDKPISYRPFKVLKFTVRNYDTENYFKSVIKHHQSPRFLATAGLSFNYEITEWIDEKPLNENLIRSLERKLQAFVNSYIK